MKYQFSLLIENVICNHRFLLWITSYKKDTETFSSLGTICRANDDLLFDYHSFSSSNCNLCHGRSICSDG